MRKNDLISQIKNPARGGAFFDLRGKLIGVHIQRQLRQQYSVP